MTTKSFIKTGLILLYGLALPSTVMAQANLQYPSPRYPELREVQSADDLLEIARTIVNRPSRAGSGFLIGWGIKPGQRVLLAMNSKFDRRVIGALEKAIREAGAKVDVLYLEYNSFFPAMEPAEGAKELDYFTYLGENVLRTKLFVKKFVEAVAEYHVVIHGVGGPNPPHAGFRWEKIPWQTLDEFISGADYPTEIVEAIDQKVWDTLLTARKVRITDPEGTDITWTVKRGDRGEHPERIRGRGHIGAYPPFDTKSILDAEGVVAGTTNHTGFFPHVKVYISKNQVTRIEGGGGYGENWKALLEKYKDVHWPGMPGPGMGYLFEVAMGTHPRSSRPANVMNESAMVMVWDRSRTGVIHWGIGLTDSVGPMAEWARERKLPEGHFHVHTYFNTFEIETEDGQKIKLIDKGHLTALDDPEVRKIAAKYGDPDELLKEAWIPAIPGINVEGDYARDYAPNPAAWATKEHEEAYGDWLRRHY